MSRVDHVRGAIMAIFTASQLGEEMELQWRLLAASITLISLILWGLLIQIKFEFLWSHESLWHLQVQHNPLPF
jgi:hypothetical protein